MVSTQDVGFGTLWCRLLGDRARWEAGLDDVPALQVVPGSPPKVGMGLVSVWIADEGPVYICDPAKGLRAIKHLRAPSTVSELHAALHLAEAIVHVSPQPRSD